MAATRRLNNELVAKMARIKATTDDPIELLRASCLERGAQGIKGLGRMFKIIDDDQSRSICFNEFKKGIRDYGLDIDASLVQTLFQQFDKDGSGSIDFDEFLIMLRPPMSNCRKALISKAFHKLDKVSDGQITVEDLKGVYNVKKHPKFLSGEWNEEQCLSEFLNSFDTPDNKDGVITEDEFYNYYSGVSASIDNNAYFDLMMRNAWGI
jgi:Ca2+-binding EF-hand superfamily protein